MARILFRDAFFEELAPGSMLETDFERVVIERGQLVFPNFHVVPFKNAVFSEEDCAKADLALVERSYREWWVVEVELGNHSLEGHVLPQVRTLARASYGEDEGRALCGACPGLEPNRVSDMLKGKQPRVLVIVDTERKEWIQPLKRYDAELLVLQMFRSDRNDHAFRIDGHLPAVSNSIVSECYFDSLVPRFLVVHSPALLGIPAGRKISIRYGKYVTEWQRIDGQDRVWLAPARQNPLSRDQNYQIMKSEDGSLEFHVISQQLPRKR
jgi:hypothetical protein